MFGSNFAANFGIPDFGYQGADVQGGFFGANAPATPGMIQNPAAQTPQAAPAAAAGPGAQPALGSPSPLAAGALAPGGGMTPTQPQQPDTPPAAPPPAAGIGSPFGKPGL